jgi:TM2 domain-containing membrane protein YozV
MSQLPPPVPPQRPPAPPQQQWPHQQPQIIYVQQAPAQQYNNGLAAVLAFLIPGLGHMYKGHVGAGLLWFVITVIGYLLLIVPGLILHIVQIFTAAAARGR